jgi:hypothetical protein
MLMQVKDKEKRPKVMTILGNRDITKINRKRKKKYEPLKLEELKEEVEMPVRLSKRSKQKDIPWGVGDMHIDIPHKEFRKSYSELEQDEVDYQTKDVIENQYHKSE